MSYTDIMGVTLDEFPTCPECAAEGRSNCYQWAPYTWYPFEDLPMWHALYSVLRTELDAALAEPVA